MNFKLTTLAAALGIYGLMLVSPVAQAETTVAAEAGASTEVALDTGRLPTQDLTPETLFLLLLAEIAGARGEVGVSVDAYIETARQTRDPRIAQRATEIALFARNMNAAVEAARLWVETDPDSAEARRVLAGVLASSGERLNEVQIQLARILAGAPEQLEQNLLGLNRALAGVTDKDMVRSIVIRLTEPYTRHQPAAHVARAQAAVSVEDGMGALDAIDSALRLRPDWEPAVLFKAQLLVQLDASRDALELLSNYLQAHPDSSHARLTYAQALVAARAFEAARDQFQQLLEQSPNDQDLMYAVALVSSQIGDHASASALFERALAAGHPEADSIRMNLGRLAEQRDDVDNALGWYRDVQPGPQHMDAQVRIAVLLARRGQVDEARLQLRMIDATEEDDRRLLLAETLVLREANRYAEALALIDDALRDEPESTELLYESAMLAERLDMLDVMEARLRKLIALDPQHAHAFNALGYSLADRGLRLDEAESLIERALELAPEDPFILDSLGWVRFRQSDLSGALTHLERAYELRPDPEIAAHLGEVLWALDRRDEASQVWQDALREHPRNQTLGDTVQRFIGK